MLNHATIQGRLTRDPELRQTQSGTPVAGFTVAWSEKYKENEQKLFMPCVAWGKQGEFVANYFVKGQETTVEGKLVTRKWEDKNGNNRETVELIVDRIHFCGPKQDRDTGYSADPGYGAAPGYGSDPGAGFVPAVDTDEDLPF